MNNKVAILIPTYRGHKDYCDRFCKSYNEYEVYQSADIWLVISNEDKACFEEYKNILIFPTEYNCSRENGIINKKKFWGLNELRELYEYIIIVDDDTIVRKKQNTYSICQKYFDSKILLGNISWDMSIVPLVKRKCMDFFTENERRTIQKQVGKMYLWFNQPAIYRTCDVDQFYNKTGIMESFMKLDYYCFDYYIYMYFLICYCDFKVVDIGKKTEFGVCEILGGEKLDQRQSLILKEHAIQFTNYLAETLSVEPFFIIHIDRKYEKTDLKIILKNKLKYLVGTFVDDPFKKA